MFENNKIQIENENKSLQDISDKYTYLKFAENIVSQDTLRKFIIADLIGLLNNKIKMYLTKFGAKFNVVFDSDMDYEFITDGGKCEYDNFSAGERARLMIAACFAFRDFMYIRNNLSSNILILDEFIDGAIDSMAIESILEILKNFSEIWKQNIFVISHRKEINNDIFNNIIRIEKTNNIAKITYLN
jgi:DNA repair exonuclease SbcCD ATPase subunit